MAKTHMAAWLIGVALLLAGIGGVLWLNADREAKNHIFDNAFGLGAYHVDHTPSVVLFALGAFAALCSAILYAGSRDA